MGETWSPRRRVASAVGLATGMVLLIAAVVPRGYIANDDIGLIEYLRSNTFTPWMSPILARTFGFLYGRWPDLAWWGLYLYALIIFGGAVLIHTCTELIDRRPGLGRRVTWLGAVLIGASHSIVVVGITWTTVSIASLGIAMAAFIAHVQTSQAAGTPISRRRAVIYGILLVNGYMLRPQGLGAMVVTLAPVAVWTVWRFAKVRYMPRPSTVALFAAPFLLVFAFQHLVPQVRDGELPEFDRFNEARGLIHGQASYEQLDSRAPELLARAGWNADEYRDFTNWLILDEAEYPAEKLERLLATKGLPERFSLQWGYRQLRATLSESGASVFLFLAAAAAGLVLALLGWIDRGRSIAFCLGYVVYLIAVPLWMAAHQRFPQRVSLSLYTVAALGLFIYLARELGDRSPDREIVRNRRHDASALGIVGVCLLGWAVNLAMWLHPPPPPHRDALQAFEDRVAARNGFVFVYVQSGLVDLDPLRARPRGYDALQGGWGTFSTLWYQSIERLGVHRGADVLRAMVDNPDAYLVSWMGARGGLEDWIRRKLGNPAARLALLDGPEFFGPGRPELFRVVTTPLVRGSDEWTLLAREELALGDLLPSAPDVSGLTFHPIAFSAPYEQYASTIEHPATSIRLAPVGNGLGCAVASDPDTSCTVTGEDSEYAGVHVPVDGLGAARFQLRLIDPENIVAFSVYAQTTTSRSIRWIWQLSEVSQQFGWSGTFTLVPRYPAGHLELAVNTARPRDIRELRFFIVVKPGTNAGFELTSLEIAPP